MADGSVTIEVELTKEQLEKGLKTLKSDLNNLEKSTSGLSAKLAKGFNAIGTVSIKAGKALTVGLTVPLIALGTAGVKYNAQMEDFEANLTTLLGSATKAKKMLADLKEMGNTTPFETADLLESTQMMLGFGLAADKTKGYLQTLGDISMGNKEKLMSLTRAFSQIGASGKATMEDINQMIDAGFNPLQVMAESTGKSMAKLRDEVSDGKISFEDISEAMEIATSEGGRYYQSMEKASQTMNGKFSTAMDALKSALGNLTQSLLPIVTKIVEKITEWANAFANLDQKTQETILKVVLIATALGPVLMVFGKIATGISGLIKAIITINGAIGVLKGTTTGATAAMKALAAIFKFIISPAGLIILAITAIIALLVVLYKKSETFRNAVNKAFTEIKNAFLKAWETIKPELEQLKQALGDLLIKLAPVGEFLINVLGVAFNIVAEVLSFLIGKLAQVIVFFINLVTNIILFFTVTIPNAFSNFITAVQNLVVSVIEWFRNLPYNLRILIGQAIGHFIQFGIDLWNWITTELPKIIQGIIEWFKQLPSKIWNWLVETVTKIGQWIINMKNIVVQKVPEVVNSVINFFKELPQNMINIGKNIVEGLWNGIVGAKDWIIQKVGEFAQGILDGMKQSLGIHSPSRVFRDEVGKYIALRSRRRF